MEVASTAICGGTTAIYGHTAASYGPTADIYTLTAAVYGSSTAIHAGRNADVEGRGGADVRQFSAFRFKNGEVRALLLEDLSAMPPASPLEYKREDDH
eukprot:2040945-Rhodomonas_salina.3